MNLSFNVMFVNKKRLLKIKFGVFCATDPLVLNCLNVRFAKFNEVDRNYHNLESINLSFYFNS